MRYRATLRADEDLFAVYADGLRDFGEAQAEKYLAGLLEAFAFVAEYPLSARERREFSPPVRMHSFGSHVIVYAVRQEDVLIIRVLHGRQDWRRHLD
jgi:toxin ParE1/3/4